VTLALLVMVGVIETLLVTLPVMLVDGVVDPVTEAVGVGEHLTNGSYERLRLLDGVRLRRGVLIALSSLDFNAVKSRAILK